MIWKNTANSYGAVARILHWAIALLFVGLIATVLTAGELPREDALRGTLMGWHKSMGVTIIPLVALRIVWKLYSRPLTALPVAVWMRVAAQLVHGALYVVMVTQPLSGLFMSILGGRSVSVFGLFSVGPMATVNKELAHSLREVHEFSGNVIYVMLALHIGAALYHHFILKDATLRRMAGRIS